MSNCWNWPSSEEVNDFPDPVGFDAEWKEWPADLADGPNKYAETFVREFVQNSWDSIQASRKSRGVSVADAGDSLSFRFEKLTGESLDKFLNASGLSELRERFRALSKKQTDDARLSESEFVKTSDLKELRVLICSESGGLGMPGHWRTGGRADMGQSRLRFALVQTASEKEDAGTGGSWGHGKKAIASASKCRSLFVYTCSEEPKEMADKPGVTNRLLGVTYWRRHTIGNSEHVGLGVFGKMASWGTFEPLENDSANQVVKSFELPGFEIRDSAKVLDRGVTYVIVEPSFGASDLRLAVERNWWPLLRQHKLEISITDEEGVDHPPVPRSIPALEPFITAWDAAHDVNGVLSTSKKIQVDKLPVGTMAAVVDTSDQGWSYREDVVNNTSVVALVRNDMVIAYAPSPAKILGKQPFARGVLNVDREANKEASDMLKRSEPHLHNEWRTQPDNSTPAAEANLAKKTLDQVHAEVLRVRRLNMRPESRTDLEFEGFSSVFAGIDPVTRSTKRDPKPRDPRNYKIQRVSESVLDINPRNMEEVRATATAEISLSELVPNEILFIDSEIELKWRVMEEGDSGGTIDVELSNDDLDEIPEGFEKIGTSTYRGRVSRSPISFTWTSNYYPDDWKVSPIARIDVPKNPSES